MSYITHIYNVGLIDHPQVSIYIEPLAFLLIHFDDNVTIIYVNVIVMEHKFALEARRTYQVSMIENVGTSPHIITFPIRTQMSEINGVNEPKHVGDSYPLLKNGMCAGISVDITLNELTLHRQ